MSRRQKSKGRVQMTTQAETPDLNRVAFSTLDKIKIREPYDATFTPQKREDLKKNPYIYTALRNTREELVAKWYGASGFTADDKNQENLDRQPQILAASALPEHEAQANHLRWNIDTRLKRHWSQVIRQLDYARDDGKAVLEIMWARQKDGPYRNTWVIDDLIHCDPDAFRFDYINEVNPITGECSPVKTLLYDKNRGYNGKPVPPGKFICLTFEEEQERDGRSILERLSPYDWYQRNNFIFWMVHLNRYGSPGLVGKYPKGSGKQVVDRLLAAIASFQQETGIVIPEDQQIQVLEAQQRDGGGFEKLNDIIVKIISEVITGNAMSLEMPQTGTYAATKVTTAEIRVILLYARASLIDSAINKQLIPWFIRYNYPDTFIYPRQQILPPKAEDIYNPGSPSQDVAFEMQPQTFAEKKLRR